MNKPNKLNKLNKDALKNSFSAKTTKLGGYSLAVGAMLLAILIVVNIIAGLLPGNLTHIDISSTKLYSVTSNTKVVISGIDKDVDIYLISQAGEEDDVLEKLLSKYDALSSHIKVTTKNPDIYPTFAQQYTDGTVTNNDIIVCCGDKYRYISYSDIYQVEGSAYSYSSYYDVYFDGEGRITSAIDYVVRDDIPRIYALTGHGEAALSDSFAESLEKANLDVVEFSLPGIDEVPEDAAMVLIHAPESDISAKELEMLESYMDCGGKLMVISGPADGTEFANLNTLLENRGVSVQEGIVIEADRSAYAFNMPYLLLPEIESSDITDPLLEGSKYVIVPIAAGLKENGTAGLGISITPLLSSSSHSFCKLAGYSLTSYEKEEGDIDGPFDIALQIHDSSANGDGSDLVWISSSFIVDDTYISYSSGANSDLVMNAVSALVGEEDTISIRSKSINNETLAISDSQAFVLKIMMVVIVPAAFILMGIAELIQRRKA